MFDRTRYKIIIKFLTPDNYTEMLDWVNNNTNGSVKVEKSRELYQNGPTSATSMIYMGFENPDDATFFKIKYAV